MIHSGDRHRSSTASGTSSSARRPTTKRWSPPSARNVSTCVGCTSTRAHAQHSTPHATAPASTSIKRRGNAFATERCPLGTGEKTGTTLGRSTLPPNRNPRAESALGALAPATTSASAGSGHPTAPKTRKPRYRAVSEALCRTRTGDPFLTMAVGLITRPRIASQSAWTRTQMALGRHQQRTASFGTLRYPLGTRPSRHRFGAGGRIDVGGETGFEPATARPPAGATPCCGAGFDDVERV